MTKVNTSKNSNLLGVIIIKHAVKFLTAISSELLTGVSKGWTDPEAEYSTTAKIVLVCAILHNCDSFVPFE